MNGGTVTDGPRDPRTRAPSDHPEVEFIVGPTRVPRGQHYAFELNNLMFHQVTNRRAGAHPFYFRTTRPPETKTLDFVEDSRLQRRSTPRACVLVAISYDAEVVAPVMHPPARAPLTAPVSQPHSGSQANAVIRRRIASSTSAVSVSEQCVQRVSAVHFRYRIDPRAKIAFFDT